MMILREDTLHISELWKLLKENTSGMTWQKTLRNTPLHVLFVNMCVFIGISHMAC